MADVKNKYVKIESSYPVCLFDKEPITTLCKVIDGYAWHNVQCWRRWKDQKMVIDIDMNDHRNVMKNIHTLRDRIRGLEADNQTLQERTADYPAMSAKVKDYDHVIKVMKEINIEVDKLRTEMRNEYLKQTHLTQTFMGKEVKYWLDLEAEKK